MSPKRKKSPKNNLSSRLKAQWAQILLVTLMLAAFGLRLIDLTDPPLDFHPTRQYRGALIARSIYHQMAPLDDSYRQQYALTMRNSVAELEPSILESVVAVGYLVTGGENLWVARIITSLFWVLAALPLYALARHMTSRGAALMSVGFYLFLPFAVQASRSFQPDPLMVALMILTMYLSYRWSATQTWKLAWLTAAVAGLTLLIKVVAGYVLLPVLVAAVLSAMSLRAALRSKQVWAMVLLTALPAAIYYLFGIAGTSGNYFQNWIVALLPLAFVPAFYVRWVNMITGLLGIASLAAALTGLLIAEARGRWLLLAAWTGYALYGITLPHQTTTHTYYHLQLVPIAALSIAPIFQLIVREVFRQEKFWQAAFAVLLAATLFFSAWVERSNMLGVSYREEPIYWQRIGEAVPTDGETIALTQHYGNLLTYYGWRRVELWPVTGELQLAGLRGNSVEDFQAFFDTRTLGMDYFLITSFNQLDLQPLLKQTLAENYSVYSQGDGYLIYDLSTP
jgi:hypothetical protein